MTPDNEVDAFERGLRQKTARNQVIAGGLALVLLLPLVAWRVFRTVDRIQRLSSSSRAPLDGPKVIALAHPERFHRFGNAGDNFLRGIETVNSGARIWGLDRLPPLLFEQLASSFDLAKKASE